MEKLGFSKGFIEIVETLYKDNISMIINKGFLSDTVMILSKTSFLSNIFPIDIKTTLNIQN